MKKIINLVLFTVLLGTLTECKKGEDDPFLSLRRRKARVVGEWKMTSGTTSSSSNSTSGSNTQSFTDNYTYTETSFSYNGSSNYNGNITTSTDAGIYSMQLTFKKDGTYSMTTNDDGNLTIENGVWNFTHGVGEYKNKEQIALTQRLVTYSGGSSTYTGKEPDYTITLKELRNKKMVFSWESTSSGSNTYGNNTSSGSSTSKGEMTLEQK